MHCTLDTEHLNALYTEHLNALYTEHLNALYTEQLNALYTEHLNALYTEHLNPRKYRFILIIKPYYELPPYQQRVGIVQYSVLTELSLQA